ncbi:MAG: ion transporter [Chloroflexi bacterium]|nr:ion transporter [Chloroflexota bacterium]
MTGTTISRPAAEATLTDTLRSAFTNQDDPWYMRIQLASTTLVLLSIFSLMAETVPGMATEYASLWHALEWVFMIGFGLEYLAHLYVARDRFRHATSFWGVVDLVAILPSVFLVLGVGVAGGFLRTLRVLRVLRTLKILRLAVTRLARSSEHSGKKRNTLWIDLQIYFMAVFVALVLSASLVYEVDHLSEGSPFTDIPTSLWWAVGMLATHGSPLMSASASAPVKIIASVTMLTGVALFSILTNVIGRSLLTTLFGDDGRDEAANQRNRRRRAEAAEAARQVGTKISDRVERAIASSGLLTGPVAPPTPAHLSHGWRRWIWSAYTDLNSREYELVSKVVTFSIFLATATIMLESVQSFVDEYGTVLEVIEAVVLFVFVLDYASQIYVAPDRWGYIRSFWGIIDLIAIVPGLSPILGITQVKSIRLFRILRVLRVLKLMKAAATRARRTVAKNEGTFRTDLEIYAIALFTAAILCGTLIWFAEGDVETGSSAPNAFEGLWFAVVALTTTGAGVNAPTTLLGRIVASSTMIVGLALFGVLTSVIGRAMLKSLFGDDGGEDGDLATVDTDDDAGPQLDFGSVSKVGN